jgi:di/tricarboxylate transporter
VNRVRPGSDGGQTRSDQGQTPEPLLPHQQLTVGVIAALIIGALALNLSLGLSAFAGLRRPARHPRRRRWRGGAGIPWGIIMMVCGVSVLIGVLEKTGGMDLFTSLLAVLASPSSINGVIAFVTGAISTYSSTSGVVLPAFLPTIPSLVGRLGGGDPLAIALSINVGSSLVDVSPLSPLAPWPSPPSAISSSRGSCSVNS